MRRKVKTAVIFASGFAEVGSDGVSEQDRIGEIARAGGLALVGPNCLGFMNFVDGICGGLFLSATDPRLPDGTEGAVAIVAQSGGLGSHLQGGLNARGVPVSCWISTGNEAGLGLADFIQYLLDDPVTQVIALYAEDIRRPQEFIDIAGEALRRGKPIVMMHPGRGAKAKEAARSHTGALTGDHAVMRTLVEHAGVVVVDTLDELMDVSELLARFPKPSQGDLGVLTFSGAFCGIAHDFCEDIGVRLPPLSQETLDLSRRPSCRHSCRRKIRSISGPRRSSSRNCCRCASRRYCAIRPSAGSRFQFLPPARVTPSSTSRASSPRAKRAPNRWRLQSSGTRRRSRPTSPRSRGKTMSYCRARPIGPCARWAKSSATAIATPHWRSAKRHQPVRVDSGTRSRRATGMARQEGARRPWHARFPRANLLAAPRRRSTLPTASVTRSQ